MQWLNDLSRFESTALSAGRRAFGWLAFETNWKMEKNYGSYVTHHICLLMLLMRRPLFRHSIFYACFFYLVLLIHICLLFRCAVQSNEQSHDMTHLFRALFFFFILICTFNCTLNHFFFFSFTPFRLWSKVINGVSSSSLLDAFVTVRFCSLECLVPGTRQEKKKNKVRLLIWYAQFGAIFLPLVFLCGIENIAR